MKILKITFVFMLFSLLTLLSQVGGVILLLWLLVFWSIKKKIKNAWVRRGVHVGGFVVVYMLFVLAIIPMLARLQDRAPLPMTKTGNLVPVTYWNVVFMRNYIITSGKEKMVKIADEFAQKHPGLKVKYMDCNYPFNFNFIKNKNTWILKGLLPHKTHTGDAADIALIFNDKNGNPSNQTRTFFGYGGSEEPGPHEFNRPKMCDKKNWQYSFMYRNIPKKDIHMNGPLTRDLILLFRKYAYSTIYIETHLQQRLKLKGSYGCANCTGVRHDDHFHVKFEK
ncbi:MAG: hypothetical protein EB023_05275 [Flavobacteriia bacterium]|nr:hypothetical protein [Flavobacteriia bacterium]